MNGSADAAAVLNAMISVLAASRDRMADDADQPPAAVTALHDTLADDVSVGLTVQAGDALSPTVSSAAPAGPTSAPPSMVTVLGPARSRRNAGSHLGPDRRPCLGD